MFRTVLKYDGKVIVEGGSGTDYSEFLEQLEGKQKASQKALIYLFFLYLQTVSECMVTFGLRPEMK